jgi:hypothetical protein
MHFLGLDTQIPNYYGIWNSCVKCRAVKRPIRVEKVLLYALVALITIS